MRRIYLDNAATTQPHTEVLEAMKACMDSCWGNPSSIHAYGREARTIIDRARRQVAELVGAAPAEIFFTSGGTEANNLALRQTVRSLGVKRAITSPTEHHAVLHTLEEMAHNGEVELLLVRIDQEGRVDLAHLEELLKDQPQTLVSLMHANNEIGTRLPLEKVSEICKQYGAYLHSDAVQTMGHYRFNLSSQYLQFTNCAAHKFHGPKGIGFCYIDSKVQIHPLITGGAQERNMRAGTENLYGIVGLAKAMEIAHRDMESDAAYVRALKDRMAAQLRERIPGLEFNGDIGPDSLYTVLNVLLPASEASDMALFKLDIQGIAASGGSACSSGSNVGSHVIGAIRPGTDRSSVRFSFSRFNTAEEIDYAAETLEKMFVPAGLHA